MRQSSNNESDIQSLCMAVGRMKECLVDGHGVSTDEKGEAARRMWRLERALRVS